MEASTLRVIFPVGGVAKRLRPLTAETSKAAVRLLNRPLIEFPMYSLAGQGVRNFIFGVKGFLNYRCLYDYFGEGLGFSARYGFQPRVHIKYQPNIPDAGSADSVRINLEYYDIRTPVFVAQGDNVCDVDLLEMMEAHVSKDAFMTIALKNVEATEEFGVAELGSEMRIKRFVEKPRPPEAPSTLANTGLYLISPGLREVFKEQGLLEAAEKRGRLDFGMDLIPFLVENGYPVYGYLLKGCWHDVGTPQRYLKAMVDILHGELKALPELGWKLPDRSVWLQGSSAESIKRREEVARKVTEGRVSCEGTILVGRHTRIGDHVRLCNSNVDNFCIVGEGAQVERSAVMDRSTIGPGARIYDSIVGRHVAVSSTPDTPTEITSNSVIGDDVTIGEGCRLAATSVYPGISIPPKTSYTSAVIMRQSDVEKHSAC